MSLRDVADLLAARRIIVNYETIRKWVTKFGKNYAALKVNRLFATCGPRFQREKR
ncbi:hypothetical protein P775_11375 [Puniceibacterium antarcticum]|uniref:Transposase n=1 Tax=Puniceibacterium antarcticum TaxID=1206336 RepID=A0A2G8RF06_9RHOB|nr:hypothetical protein P775_11375 [Puniceibacterium antarcticum]